MKKIVSILLVCLLLFNVLGYYGLLIGLRYKNGIELKQQFDHENFGSMQTVTIKVPLVVPYGSDSRGFERVDGEFEYNGQSYRLIKQKLYQDTLYIVCMNDNRDNHIRQALNDYVKTFTDKPADANQQQNAKLFQSFIKDFLSNSVSVELQTAGWEKTLSYFSIENQYQLLSSTVTSPPPRA